MSRLYERISTAIMEGDADKTASLVGKALAQSLATKDILDNDMVVGMGEVGGAPVDAALAERISADGYGSNAPSGVDLAQKLVGAA